ncbi:MAG: hypothetical protein ACFCUO_11910 [Rhodospirillales bacterium]
MFSPPDRRRGAARLAERGEVEIKGFGIRKLYYLESELRERY